MSPLKIAETMYKELGTKFKFLFSSYIDASFP